jgi:hypothetical protein
MTQAEIEAELASLRARLSQLEQEQDFSEKNWAKLGLVSLCAALAFLATSVAFGAIDLWFHKSSPQPTGFGVPHGHRTAGHTHPGPAG